MRVTPDPPTLFQEFIFHFSLAHFADASRRLDAHGAEACLSVDAGGMLTAQPQRTRCPS
jgi:hypothetical protein